MSGLAIYPITSAPQSIEVKRLNLPFLAVAHCPACGEKVENRYTGEDYLSYPYINQAIDLSFYHQHGDDDHAWTERAVLRVSLEVYPPSLDERKLRWLGGTAHRAYHGGGCPDPDCTWCVPEPSL